MCKFSPLLHKYREILLTKSNYELTRMLISKQQLKRQPSRSQMIKKLLELAQKQNPQSKQIEQHLNVNINIDTHPINVNANQQIKEQAQIEANTKITSKTRLGFNIKMWQKIRNLNQRIYKNYANKFSNKETIKVYQKQLMFSYQKLINNSDSAQNQIIQDFMQVKNTCLPILQEIKINQINKQMKDLLKSTDKSIDDVQSDKSQGIAGNHRKLMIFADLTLEKFIQNTIRLSTVKATNLNNLNIQTQIIYPSNLIKKDYEYSQEQYYSLLLSKDTGTISRFFNDILADKAIKTLSGHSTLKRVRDISQAMLYFGIVKQMQFLQQDFVLKYISNQIKYADQESYEYAEPAEKEQLIKFVSLVNRNWRFYQSHLIRISFNRRCELINQIVRVLQENLINSVEKSITMRYHDDLLLLNFAMVAVAQQHSKFQSEQFDKKEINRKREIDETNRLALVIVQLWLKFAQFHETRNSYQINVVLEGLLLLEKLIKNLEKYQIFYSKTVEKNQAYFLVKAQALQETRKIFEDQRNLLNIQADSIAKILSDFIFLCNDRQIPTYFIETCILNICSLPVLSVACRRTLLALLARKQSILLEIVQPEVVKKIIKGMLGLNIQEVLMTIQIITNNQFVSFQKQILDLLTNNVEADSLDEEVREYLMKVTKQKMKSPEIKAEMENFLKVKK